MESLADHLTLLLTGFWQTGLWGRGWGAGQETTRIHGLGQLSLHWKWNLKPKDTCCHPVRDVYFPDQMVHTLRQTLHCLRHLLLHIPKANMFSTQDVYIWKITGKNTKYLYLSWYWNTEKNIYIVFCFLGFFLYELINKDQGLVDNIFYLGYKKNNKLLLFLPVDAFFPFTG